MTDRTPETADLEAVRQKYATERAKRLRPEGREQYREIEGALGYYEEDPYVDAAPPRERVTDDVDAIVVGAGFSGLLAGGRLREAGLTRVRIIDSAGDVGGTWYWNRYPGVQCDIESYIYLPLLEELGYIPTEKYAYGPEIFAHTQAMARHFGLYDDALFSTRVTSAAWHDDSSRWVLATDRDDRLTARYVVLALGPLNKPKLPGIAGLENFGGHSFHSSRWDYGYTGGDTTGGLTKLSDKRVAVIGTGATAVQCIPHLGESAEHLYVFQRTPSSVDERGNRPTDAEWVRNLEPGWQQRRIENFGRVVSGSMPPEGDLVQDGWTDLLRRLTTMAVDAGSASSPDELIEALELADLEKMESIRARVERIVGDPRTAESLKPYYRQFCKRPCFHDSYLETFNRPNVTLVDTDGKGVERITERGLVANGVEYEVDCIVFASGFEVGTDYVHRAGFDVIGREGTSLHRKWHRQVATLHGLMTAQFPNLFFMGGSQTGISPNFTELYTAQSEHLAHIVATAEARRARSVEATPEAEAEWVETIRRSARSSMAFYESCTPGYYNNEGKPAEGGGLFVGGSFGGGAAAFFEMLREWRDDGDLAGLRVE